MPNDDESLTTQLVNDLQEHLSSIPGYEDITVKASYEEFPTISYPLVVIAEIENSSVSKYYDLKEHVVNVTYQIYVYATQSETLDATENCKTIITLIRDYMRGKRYHALKRLGNTPITKREDDYNVRIGYMRYVGQLDIDTHTIYRRN